MKILFVDDDELAIAYGEILLSETGKVVTAQDGLLALTIVQNEPIDVVISDIEMPRVC